MLDWITLDRFDLRPKLIIAFVLVALLVGVTGLVGYQAVSTVDSESHVISEDADKIDASMETLVAVEEQQIAVQEALLGEAGAQAAFDEAQTNYNEWIEKLEQTDLNDEQQQAIETLRTRHEDYTVVAQEIFEATQAGEIDRARANMDELEPLIADMRESAHTLEEVAVGDKEAAVASADSTTQTVQLAILGLTIGAFVAAIAIGLFVAGRIIPPITQLSESARAMSNGDLDDDLEPHVEDDELGRMIDSFADMQKNLQGVFSQVGTASQNLNRGDLDWDIDTEYPGQYGEAVTNLDAGADQLAASFDEIKRVSADLEKGDLSGDIDTDRPGQYGAVLDDLSTGMTQLSESFGQISTASEDLKRGQLAQEIDTDYPGTYGAVLTDLEGGIERLGDSIENVQTIADRVATSSGETAQSTEEIEQASEQVAQSVEEISRGTDTQSDNLQEVANEMNDMSATVEEIASSAEEVAATAGTAVKRSDEGRDYAAEATEEIESIETQAAEAGAQVETLDEQMAQIGEIVEMITEIAEQTNMLALNASIEAARAGEAGEGFGVVASEIKSLAEEAAQATADIENRIETVQTTTSDTVEGMQQMSERVERGSETIEDAIEMFDEIADAVQQAESGIREISDATDDQAASSEEVVSMVDEVSSLSQQTAAEASNVSAATEEQTASLSEASENVQELSALAEDLHDQVSDFETRTDSGMANQTHPSAAADGGFGTHDPSPGTDQD